MIHIVKCKRTYTWALLVFFCHVIMSFPATRIFTPALGWTSVRPDLVPMMMSLQTSSHKPASRILAEASPSSWRPHNSAVAAVDTDLSMKNYHLNFRPGVKKTYSYVIHSHSGVIKDNPFDPIYYSLASRLIKYFLPGPG